MHWCVMPSARSECGESVSRTRVVMRQADASLKNSASCSKVFREMRIYFRAERVRTDTVTLDPTSLACPTCRGVGRAIGTMLDFRFPCPHCAYRIPPSEIQVSWPEFLSAGDCIFNTFLALDC